MVNENSTVTNIQEYIESANVFDNVKVFHNRNQGLIIYEAYGDNVSIDQLKSSDDLGMVFATYGMNVSKETDTNGDNYYRFECNESFLIDDR